MYAIVTQYFGPGQRTGSCIRARADKTALRVDYDHSLSLEQNHIAAAHALAVKLGWLTVGKQLLSAEMPHGHGMAHIYTWSNEE